MPENISVIVTTYNRPEALKLVLDSLNEQTDLGFEVIVADDGSTDETRIMVNHCASQSRIPLQHVWQQDEGFRAAAIRNKAMLVANGDYLLFTDGDCVPPRDFVASHRRLAETGNFVAGNRILLSEAFSAKVLAEQLPIHNWSSLQWLKVRLAGGINRVLPIFRLPLPGAIRKNRGNRWAGVKTCNLSVWRADFERVNGFDERYCGWGLEDSDLVIRLLRSGIRHKSARFAAPVFHLWHREFDRLQLPENRQRLETLLRNPDIFAEDGLAQHRR